MPLRSFLLLIGSALLGAATIVLATSASAQIVQPEMTASPQSGERPLTVTVTGTACSASKVTTDATPLEIHLRWQVQNIPSTAATKVIDDGINNANWTTTLVLGIPNIGVNEIEATCISTANEQILTYPSQTVDVQPVAPVLSASPTTITVGGSLTASADRCPDPDQPQLGAAYSVVFMLEYLVPPDGTEGAYSESRTVFTTQDGTASTSFTVPADAPTQGSAYRVTAMCQFEELGNTETVFFYSSAGITVNQPQPTPTPTPSTTTVPTPVPTVSPSPTPTAGPTSTPAPTITPTPTPVSGNPINFTG